MPGVIISVANNKGGVGKSSVTVNLADALARQNQKVLVIDNDSQCNATSILIAKDFKFEKSLYDLLDPESDEKIEQCICGTGTENLFCIPNSPDTGTLEPYLIKHSSESLYILRKKIRDYAIENFDFTFIDNPPNMGLFVISSLYASDFVIVPNLASSAFSLEGLRKAIKLIRDIQEDGNPDLRFLRLLVNQLDKRTIVSRIILSTITQSFPPEQIFKTVIPSSTVFQQAELMGQTIFRYSGGSSGAKAYRDLAKELLSIFGK